jgi:formiminoglutamase
VTPPEVADRVCASAADIFEDGDAFTREIYEVSRLVAHHQAAHVARAFMDLNRATHDRPPANPDGIVKTATCFDRPIYVSPLDDASTERLIAKYYEPYHTALYDRASRGDLLLGLDCHSMAAMPPPVAPDRGVARPLFCLSNGEGQTCDDAMLHQLARAMAEAFGCPEDDVALNRPFKGGYITRRHGHNPLPWIQVEMNRSLYLARPWFDPETRTVTQTRLGELRDRFAAALESFVLGVGA